MYAYEECIKFLNICRCLWKNNLWDNGSKINDRNVATYNIMNS
jgi:hypothetical protein